MGIAGLTKCPEMVLSDGEADMLANATATLMKEFDFAPDPKMQAIVGLVAAASIVYVPRAAVINMRRMRNVTPRSRTEPKNSNPNTPPVVTAAPAASTEDDAKRLQEELDVMNANPEAYVH